MSIKDKYISIFFENLTKEEKDEIWFWQYMWHAFSYNKVESKKGNKAIESLRKHKSNDVYIIFQRNEEVLEEKNVTYEQIYNNVLDNKWDTDCYIIDKNFKWTFVLTHETVDDELEKIYKQQGEIPQNTYIDVKDKQFYIGPFYKEL